VIEEYATFLVSEELGELGDPVVGQGSDVVAGGGYWHMCVRGPHVSKGSSIVLILQEVTRSASIHDHVEPLLTCGLRTRADYFTAELATPTKMRRR